MLWLGSWIVLLAFWCYALRIAVLDSWRLAAGFIALWICARLGLAQLSIEGPIYFVSFAALLTTVMIFIDLYRSNLGSRNPVKSPLDEIPLAKQRLKD